jgi:acetoacetyl-CoA synthetase
MASTYVEVIRLVQPRGPYAIAGYSFGGLVAFEMARRLSAEGERVDTLALIDSYLNPACLSTRARWRFAVSRPLRYFPYILGAPRTRARAVARNAMRRLARGGRRPSLHGPDYPRMPRWAQLEQIGFQGFIAYRPKPHRGQAVLFHARTRYPSFCDPAAAWPRYVLGGLARHRIDGEHGLVHEGSAGQVAELLSTQLKAAEARSSGM